MFYSFLTVIFFSFFELTASQLNDINMKNASIHFRLFSILKKSDIEWSDNLDLAINGVPTEIIKRKTRTAPVKDPFIIPQSPLIFSHILKTKNEFVFYINGHFDGYFVIQLVKPVSVEKVIIKICILSNYLCYY